MQACRVVGGVGQRDQGAGGLVETLHPAAADDGFGAAVGQVETPHVAPALLFGREQQRLPVVLPQQRRLHLMVPFAAFE
jgi:hypothetical protein